MYQNFSPFWYNFTNLARFGLWLWTSGPPTCSYSTWLWIPTSTLATRPTRTPSRASRPTPPPMPPPSSATLGTSTPASRRMPKISVKVPKGFPRDSTNLKVKQADAVMLSYPLRRPVPPPYDTTTRTVALQITQRTPAAESS